MLLLHPFDDPSRITTGAIEILLRVVQLSLVLSELRIGDIETLLKGFLAAPLGCGHQRSQPRSLLLVCADARLGFLDASQDFSRLRSQRGRMRVSLAQR